MTRWMVVETTGVDGLEEVHVVPEDGNAEHAESEACVCGPRWEVSGDGASILVHWNTSIFYPPPPGPVH